MADGSHAEAELQKVSVPAPDRGQKRQAVVPPEDPRTTDAGQADRVLDSVAKWDAMEGPMTSIAEYGIGRKSVVRYRSIEDKTVGTQEVYNHPGPIVQREGQDNCQGYAAMHGICTDAKHVLGHYPMCWHMPPLVRPGLRGEGQLETGSAGQVAHLQAEQGRPLWG